jgi:hypothetical protein
MRAIGGKDENPENAGDTDNIFRRPLSEQKSPRKRGYAYWGTWISVTSEAGNYIEILMTNFRLGESGKGLLSSEYARSRLRIHPL